MNRPSECQTSEWLNSLGWDSLLSEQRFVAVPVAAWRSRAASETAEEQMDRDRSIIAQNAGTTAAALYNAIHGDGPWDPVSYDAIRLHVFNGTLELAGAAAIVEVFTPDRTGDSNVGQSVPTNSNGDAGGGVELKFGKYKGKTIADVAGTEDGLSWLNWAAAQSNNDFIKSKAGEYLRANGLLETAAA